MSIMTQRYEAVSAAIGRIAAIQRDQGVTPGALAAIKTELIALATRADLFPQDEFQAPEKGALYRLAEDADRNFALYAVTCQHSRSSPVHNHTTWAAIAGVRGAEHNAIYERTDNRSTPGFGRLRQTGEHTVVSGTAVAYLPDDFHAIEMIGDGPWLQLHLYGRSLEHLPGRIKFEGPEGGAYEVYPANPTIATLELPARGQRLHRRRGRTGAAGRAGGSRLLRGPPAVRVQPAAEPAGGGRRLARAAPRDPRGGHRRGGRRPGAARGPAAVRPRMEERRRAQWRRRRVGPGGLRRVQRLQRPPARRSARPWSMRATRRISRPPR